MKALPSSAGATQAKSLSGRQSPRNIHGEKCQHHTSLSLQWRTHRGPPLSHQASVVTLRNFGRVNLNGIDVGLNYQFNDRTSGWLNYSHMSLVDLEDPRNDFDGDGKFEESSFNTPENKASFGIAFTDLFARGLFGAVSGRWVEAYDFISGAHRATKAGEGTAEFWLRDREPLAGFATLDVYLSYAISSRFQASPSATNLFNEGLRDTVCSPEIRRLILTEFEYTIRRTWCAHNSGCGQSPYDTR